MSMNDFHLIYGKEPKEINKLYGCYDGFKSEISYGRFNFNDWYNVL